jgi:purine-cytosine permease-like protein
VQPTNGLEEYVVPAGQGVDEVGKVETRGIDQIPDVERNSRPLNLAAAFISVQFSFVIIVFGSFPISWGLGWWSTMAAVTVGTIIGSIVLALIGLSGPLTGTNQSVTSGAFFGVHGRLIGTAIALFIDIGFLAIIAWTTGQTFVDGLHALFNTPSGNGPLAVGMFIACVLIILIGYFGHATLVASYKLWIIGAIILQVLMVIVYAPQFKVLPDGKYLLGDFWPTWLLAVTIAVSLPLSYITWPNDYTRRMPRDTGRRNLALWAGVGSFVGCWLALMIGAYVTSVFPDPTTPIVDGAFAASPTWFIIPLMLYGLLGNTVNGGPGVYNSALDLQALLFRLRRNVVVLIIGAIVLVVAYVGVIVLNAVDTIDAFVIIMLVVVSPWAVINILGMWRRHFYFKPDDLHAFAVAGARGIYWFNGGLNYRAITAFVIGAIVGLMFSDTTIFVGPFSQALGGVDFSFTSAGITGGVLYLIFVTLFPERGVMGGEEPKPTALEPEPSQP